MTDNSTNIDDANLSIELLRSDTTPINATSEVVTTPAGRIIQKVVKRTSWVWKYFKIDEESQRRFCLVKNCMTNKIVTSYPSNTSVSNLANHLNKSHNIEKNTTKTISNQQLLDTDLSIKAPIGSIELKSKILKALTKFIVENKEPFNLVESNSFKEFVGILSPNYIMPSRQTLVRSINDEFFSNEKWFMDKINGISGLFSLTIDGWSSRKMDGYIVITIHWIDDTWTMQNSLLEFIHFPSPHNSVTTYELILNVLEKYNLINKIKSITTDNGPEMPGAIEYLRSKINSNGVTELNKDWHVRCICHIINLSVKDAIKSISSNIDKLRNLIKSIRYSIGLRAEFKRIQLVFGSTIASDVPGLDVDNRWNSLFEMIKKAYALKDVFQALTEKQEYKVRLQDDALSEQEWELLLVYKNFFEDAKINTTFASSANYPAISLQPLIYKYLINHCDNTINGTIPESNLLKDAATKMKTKLQKYQPFLESELSKIALFLDPRDNNESTTTHIKAIVRQILENKYGYLFRNSEQLTKKRNILFCGNVNSVSQFTGDEIDDYCNYTSRGCDDSIDILLWWKTIGSVRFPKLSLLAKDTHMAMASSVPSESAFSDSGQTVTPHRSNLSHSNIENVMKLRSWLKFKDRLSVEEPIKL